MSLGECLKVTFRRHIIATIFFLLLGCAAASQFFLGYGLLSLRSMDGDMVTAADGSFDMEETKLTEDIIKGFAQLRSFKEAGGPITSLAFSDNGELCITTSEDHSLNIYNCVTGE